MGFMIWSLAGCVFLGLGIYSFFTEKTMHFWANAEQFEVTDKKKYNRAVGRLFCVYGIVFILLGLPLLAGQNNPWIILSVLGVMLESIVLMAIYTIVIEKKYKK